MCLNKLKLDLRNCSLQETTIALYLVMTLILISFLFFFSSSSTWLLVLHLEYHCIVLRLFRLTNCLKIGWSLRPKRCAIERRHGLVEKKKKIKLYFSYTLLIRRQDNLAWNVLYGLLELWRRGFLRDIPLFQQGLVF